MASNKILFWAALFDTKSNVSGILKPTAPMLKLHLNAFEGRWQRLNEKSTVLVGFGTNVVLWFCWNDTHRSPRIWKIQSSKCCVASLATVV